MARYAARSRVSVALRLDHPADPETAADAVGRLQGRGLAPEKVQAKLVGFRTKLSARLLAIAGIVVGFHDEILPLVSGQDWTSLTAKLPAWSLPLGMVMIAWLFEKLRRITDNPPHVIMQKDDAGVAKVVAVEKPAS